MKRILPLMLAGLMSSGTALAQSENTDASVVREIERGWFLKSNVGSTIYLGARRQVLRPGTTLAVTFGADLLDKPTTSAGFEVILQQAMHNGLSYDVQPQVVDPSAFTQGDMYTFSAVLAGEFSFYPVRRFGIGARLGGGVMLTPLLLERTAYDEQVVGTGGSNSGAWGGPQFRPAVHDSPHPVILVGPTFEYYTKLSHFSIGVDADFIYAIGVDFGTSITGYLKYTF